MKLNIDLYVPHVHINSDISFMVLRPIDLRVVGWGGYGDGAVVAAGGTRGVDGAGGRGPPPHPPTHPAPPAHPPSRTLHCPQNSINMYTLNYRAL